MCCLQCTMCVCDWLIPCLQLDYMCLGLLVYEMATGKRPYEDIYPLTSVVLAVLHGKVELNIEADHFLQKQGLAEVSTFYLWEGISVKGVVLRVVEWCPCFLPSHHLLTPIHAPSLHTTHTHTHTSAGLFQWVYSHRLSASVLAVLHWPLPPLPLHLSPSAQGMLQSVCRGPPVGSNAFAHQHGGHCGIARWGGAGVLGLWLTWAGDRDHGPHYWYSLSQHPPGGPLTRVRPVCASSGEACSHCSWPGLGPSSCLWD